MVIGANFRAGSASVQSHHVQTVSPQATEPLEVSVQRRADDRPPW
jgi:hypothetical protein